MVLYIILTIRIGIRKQHSIHTMCIKATKIEIKDL